MRVGGLRGGGDYTYFYYVGKWWFVLVPLLAAVARRSTWKADVLVILEGCDEFSWRVVGHSGG